MASDHLRSVSGDPHSEMVIRALPFGGYVVYAAGLPGSFNDFLAAFGDLTAALAFIEQRILRNPAQELPVGHEDGFAHTYNGEPIGPLTKAALQAAGAA